MVFDKTLYSKVKKVADNQKHLMDMKMFGGVGFLLKGNMCFGVYKDFLILRLGPEEANKALTKKHVKDFDITGRPMKGWVMVHHKGLSEKHALTGWIDLAYKFVDQMPRK